MDGNITKKPNKKALVKSVLLLVLIIWTIWGNSALMVTEISIFSGRIPAAFSGFLIAQISDLHNAQFGKNNAALIKNLSQQQPDIIVITGDFIDSNHTDIEVALDFVQEAVLIAPVYYVTGNHEAWCTDAQLEQLKTGLETAGVTILENEAVQLERDGQTITLMGLSDPFFGATSSSIPRIIDSLKNDAAEYTILLAHRPELFETYADANVDLVLSGHAHGGQFRLPLIGGLVAPDQGLLPQYDSGLYTDGATNMIVSRGLGNSIIPLRFNNRPEIVLVKLQAE